MTSTNQNPPDDQVQRTIENSDIEPPLSATSSATTPDIPSFGWSAYAERVNGRFAMIGFIAVLLIEAFSQDAFLHWAGFVP